MKFKTNLFALSFTLCICIQHGLANSHEQINGDNFSKILTDRRVYAASDNSGNLIDEIYEVPSKADEKFTSQFGFIKNVSSMNLAEDLSELLIKLNCNGVEGAAQTFFNFNAQPGESWNISAIGECLGYKITLVNSNLTLALPTGNTENVFLFMVEPFFSFFFGSNIKTSFAYYYSLEKGLVKFGVNAKGGGFSNEVDYQLILEDKIPVNDRNTKVQFSFLDNGHSWNSQYFGTPFKENITMTIPDENLFLPDNINFWVGLKFSRAFSLPTVTPKLIERFAAPIETIMSEFDQNLDFSVKIAWACYDSKHKPTKDILVQLGKIKNPFKLGKQERNEYQKLVESIQKGEELLSKDFENLKHWDGDNYMMLFGPLKNAKTGESLPTGAYTVTLNRLGEKNSTLSLNFNLIGDDGVECEEDMFGSCCPE